MFCFEGNHFSPVLSHVLGPDNSGQSEHHLAGNSGWLRVGQVTQSEPIC